MPYIILFVWYPPSQSNTVAKRYLQTLQKYPVISSIKRVVPGAVAGTKDGVESIIVDEVKREDIGEALEYIGKFIVEFRDIEGFRHQVRIFNTVSEVLSLIGMG